MAHPSAEDFEQWLDNPVTRWVMAAARKQAANLKETWVDQSWEAGRPAPLALHELKARHDAYLDLCEATYDVWHQINYGDDE